MIAFPVNVASISAQYLGVNRVVRALRQKSLLVLCYHGVVPDEDSRSPALYGNVIGVTEFSRQMEELTRYFHPISDSELKDWRAGSLSVRRNPALVTFDDGYRNNLTCAAPVLERLGIPATILISAGYIGSQRILWPDEVYLRALAWPERLLPMPEAGAGKQIPDGLPGRRQLAGYVREMCKRVRDEQRIEYLTQLRKHELPQPQDNIYSFLSWREVRALKSRGFEIGSHTVEHPILTQVQPERLEFELKESKRVIEEQIGSECRYFSYPNGGPLDVSPKVVEEIRRAGYSFAFTVTDRLASADDDPLLMARVYIPGGISTAEFHGRLSGLRGTLKHWLAR
jgi:peptidoglycan/xylan/chitin deacetylase (PgdA/CDA1 family)